MNGADEVVMDAYLQLPKLSEQVIAVGEVGSWAEDESLIQHLKEHLETPGNPSRNIESGVPTFWARPLMYEFILFNGDHPLHDKIKNEWLAILSVLYFKDELKKQEANFNLYVKDYNFAQGNNNMDTALRILKPDKFEQEGFRMIFINDILIGAEHPRTIFFTPPEFPEEIVTYVPWLRKRADETYNVVDFLKVKKDKGIIDQSEYSFVKDALVVDARNFYKINDNDHANVRTIIENKIGALSHGR